MIRKSGKKISQNCKNVSVACNKDIRDVNQGSVFLIAQKATLHVLEMYLSIDACDYYIGTQSTVIKPVRSLPKFV